MLAGTIGSRPIGSPENLRARQYVIDQLRLFGYDVRVQETDARRPDYGLTTSTTDYDSTYGNSTASINYGDNSYLGQVANSTADPNGLNLTSTATYEQPNTTGSYLRQTSDTAPGGATTTYNYYNADEAVANPCVGGSSAALQAGMLKSTTDPTGLTTTVVYDDSGDIVATKTGSDNWECKTYDDRGRAGQEDRHHPPHFRGNA